MKFKILKIFCLTLKITLTFKISKKFMHRITIEKLTKIPNNSDNEI